MQAQRALLVFGVVLLAISALLGFVQHWYRAHPERFARWRVVHAGGTAGAVQLLALAAVWGHCVASAPFGACLAAGLISATLAFFFGPLARALSHPRLAAAILAAGAIVALPTYIALPFVLLR